MKNRIILLLFFASYFNSIYSQSIFSALHIDSDLELRKNILVSEITTEITFFNQDNIERKKEITSLNSKNKIITELRYDSEDNLKERLTRIHDSTGTKSISRKIERWHPIIGYTSETAFYEYDEKGFLTKVIDKNQNNKVIRETTIINNEKGDPIELKLKTDRDVDFGIEIAEYDYLNNSVITKVLDKNGKIISTNNGKIDYSKKEENDIVNEFGDITKSEDYEYEFKYDKKGNWTTQVRFKIIGGKRIKNAEFRRKLKYRK
ncbi:MAG: hypothetical protein ACOVLG_04950 [Flavobacterium sp.]